VVAFVFQFILTPGAWLWSWRLFRSQPHPRFSSWRYLVGGSAVEYNLMGLPATYALAAGMGRFFGVVSKVPITAIVIVFEMTTDFNLVLPLMAL